MSAPTLPGVRPADAAGDPTAATAASDIPAATARPSVALLRGAYLSPFEMQTYEKLLDRFDMTAWRLTVNRFATDLVQMPMRDILCIDEPFARVSGKLAFYFNLFLQATNGLDYLHLGLVDKLQGVDIVHTMETFNAFSHQGLQAKRKHGARLVTTVWENRPFAAERFAAKRRMKYEVLAEADLHIAITERARQCLLLEGADPERVVTIPAGMDTERFTPEGDDGGLRERLGIGPDELVLLSVAALRWEKGVHDIVHALHALTRDPATRHLPLRLILAGSGPEEQRLRDLADRIGLGERVIITRFSYDEMPAAYRAADAFVLASTARPGWLEQFGYVLPEAMASGLPVVATRSGSIDEVVGDAGLLVPPSDFLGLAGALRTLLLDDDHRAELGAFAREWAVQRYDSRVVCDQLADSYRRVLEA